ncbi:MAG: glycosyl hydrolase family 18 protein [Acetivibrionales bacterium]|jgi:hypothetical protein
MKSYVLLDLMCFRAINNKTSLVAQIVSAVSQYGFDGINIDIENLTHDDRNQYTSFIEDLRESMPRDKTVSIAVAANPYGVYYGWAGSYDYQALGELCDWIMVMAYDEHYYGSKPGPVASSEFTENSLKYALKLIPANKLLLGVPFYGRYWKEGAAKGGSGITCYDAESLVNKYKSTVSYDSSTQTAKAVVTIGVNDPKPIIWGGVVLGAGTYTIYYDNYQSLRYKLSLVQKYNILGTGSWCLGQEGLKTWGFYRKWLNGKYFSDILGHYAQDDILDIANKGWMIGVSSDAFAPNRTLTRAEAAVILVRALGLEKETPAEDFSDTENHGFRDMIGIARKYQILLGDGRNRFWPDSPLTREQMAMVLDRILVLPNPVTKHPFSDISPNKNPLSYDSIMRLANNGIVVGNGKGTYNPLGRVLRGEMAAFVNRSSVFEMTYPTKRDPSISSPDNIVTPR